MSRIALNSLLTDSPYIAKEVDAVGVHLGQKDMDISEAQSIVGENKIIGGTANTFVQIKKLYEKGAHYIGLGPLRFTQTKKNLSPLSDWMGTSI